MGLLNRFFIFLCVISVTLAESISNGIAIKKLERKIDITSQLTKISCRITLENAGSSSIKSFHYALQNQKDLSFLTASSGGSELKITPVSIPQRKDVFFRIDLKDSLNPGKSVNIDVESIFTHTLTPYPQSIQQGEKQLVEYNDNHYFYSPYPVSSQTTTISLLSPNVISYSRLKPSSQLDSSITYGPYENVAPYSFDPMKIHYENNSPFLVVTQMKRTIEISHWGNIAVEETIDVLHSGAKLKGSFSRYDFQREHNTYSSVKAFKTVLPASAKDVYYRDEIGNISTSHMRIQEDAVELDLRPRFPLFGGWKTQYTIGYNVPSYEYLFNSGDNFLLKMRFIDHIFDDMIVDDISVKIILPEGVSNLEFRQPYPIERLPDELHYTYLDIFGRPVLNLNKKNLVENHIQDFELHYRFPVYRMLLEPLIVVVAFFLTFFVVILYVRLDLTLSKDEVTEAKMRVSSKCELVHTHQDKRAIAYEKLEEEIAKLKTTKDVSHTQAIAKKLFATIKDDSQIISDVASKIKADSVDYADKINELQKHDKVLQECLQQQLTNVEKLVNGKMNKQHFVEAETNLHKKKESTFEKIKTILLTI